MPERVPTPPPFDPAAISEALRTDIRATTDLASGPGQPYDLASGHLSLEVFPEHPLTRITTAAARVELFGSPPPQVVDGQIVFGQEAAQEDATLTVSPEGSVVFGYVHCPPAPAELATAPEPAQESPPAAPTTSSDAPPADDEPPATDTTPLVALSPVPAGTGHYPDPVASQSASRTADTSTKEQQPRLQLTGRLGRDPSFRTSPRGTLVGRFPLAVHRDDGTTTWHSVLAFGERAKLLQHRSETGELTKGQEVSLIGYPHTRAQPTRDGGSKTVTEIYAVAVTRR